MRKLKDFFKKKSSKQEEKKPAERTHEEILASLKNRLAKNPVGRDLLDAVEKSGCEIVHEDLGEENGCYDPETNKISLDFNKDEDLLVYILAHESEHLRQEMRGGRLGAQMDPLSQVMHTRSVEAMANAVAYAAVAHDDAAWLAAQVEYPAASLPFEAHDDRGQSLTGESRDRLLKESYISALEKDSLSVGNYESNAILLSEERLAEMKEKGSDLGQELIHVSYEDIAEKICVREENGQTSSFIGAEELTGVAMVRYSDTLKDVQKLEADYEADGLTPNPNMENILQVNAEKSDYLREAPRDATSVGIAAISKLAAHRAMHEGK